jgi:DNA modification methylase
MRGWISTCSLITGRKNVCGKKLRNFLIIDYKLLVPEIISARISKILEPNWWLANEKGKFEFFKPQTII